MQNTFLTVAGILAGLGSFFAAAGAGTVWYLRCAACSFFKMRPNG
jgi:hypothetical protein